VKVALHYYSGAGNTKFIAKKLKKILIARSHEADLIQVNSKSILDVKLGYDLYVIGFPVYDISSPGLVKDLVSRITDEGKPIAYFNTKAFMSGDSILELADVSNSNGLKLVGFQDFYMPASDALALFAKKGSTTEKIIKFFHTRNIDDKLEGFVTRIDKNQEIKIKPKWYNILAYLIPKSAKEAFHNQYTVYIPEFYSDNNLCIECMLCVNQCPRENIMFEEGIKFELNCDMCLSCLHHCPVDAIQIGNMTKGNVRLRKIEIKN
jgi:ferredoxin